MALRVELGGKVGVEVDGARVPTLGLGRLGPPVLAYLVAERHRPVSRDELADLLWPDDLPSSWEQMVRGVISTLRALLRTAGLPATEVLTTELGCYQLHLPEGAVVDVETAETEVARAEALLAAGDAKAALEAAEAAAAIASRQFLSGMTGVWVERRQAEMRELHLRALEVVAAAATACSRWAAAVSAAEDAIALEPYRESAYLRLVEAHASAGNRGEALRAYERCRRQLVDELGVGPSPSTEALYLSLLGDEPSDAASPITPPLPVLPGPLADVPGAVLAGRDAELQQLTAALRRADTDGHQVFLVAGEPGIGKTALVGAFARASHADGVHVLYGRCDEDLGVPYQPFVEAIEGYVAWCPLDELKAHVATHGGELSRLTSALARRLPETPPPPVTDPEADRFRLLQAIRALLASAAMSRPVVVVLDDLQWAANETLLLLRHLVRKGAGGCLMVVGTYRHTEVGASHPLASTLADLRREASVERLVLDGLDEAGIDAIVAQGDSRLASKERLSLVRAVHAHTAGNPFFAGELVRHLSETGSLYQRAGRWSLYDARHQVDVPQSVRDVVSRRLRRLSDPSNRALVLASVVGSEFVLDLLDRVVGTEHGGDALDPIEEAVSAHLVVELDQGRYRFSHDLVRDTVYSGLSTTRRCRLHRQVAEAIEAGPHGPGGPPVAALAHHFAEAASASCAAKAADYAVAAARQAIAVAAWDEAATRLERGLEALELQEPPDLERRCDLLLLLAETWLRFFHPPRVVAAATQALELARRLGSAQRLAQAAYFLLRTAASEATASPLELAAEALGALDALGEAEPGLRAKLMTYTSWHRPEALDRIADEALALARRSGDQGALGVALTAAASRLRGSPSLQEYMAVAEELVAAAPPDVLEWRNGPMFRGMGRLALGDRAGFEVDLAGCLRLGAGGRFWYFEWIGTVWKATLALLDGRFSEVASLAAAASAVAPPDMEDGGRFGSGRRIHDELYLRQLFRVHVERGDRAAALDTALRCVQDNEMHRAMLLFALSEGEGIAAHRPELEAFVDHGLGPMQPERVPVTLSYRTEVAMALGGVERLTKLYDEFRPYRGQVVIGGMAEGCTGAVDRYLGMLAAAAGRRAEAESHFKAALSLEAGLHSPPLIARTKHWYGRSLRGGSRADDASRARQLLTDSLDTASRLGMAALVSADRECLEYTYSASTTQA